MTRSNLWQNEFVHVLRPTRADLTKEIEIMLWTIIVILVILWLLGFIGGVGSYFIHLLLVIAVIILIFNLISGRRSV